MQADLYLQLGIAGASLLLIYIFIQNIFVHLKDTNNLEGTKLERLCDKIEGLIESNAKLTEQLSNATLVWTNYYQESTSKYDNLVILSNELKFMTNMINERTKKCLDERSVS